ncbi:MAG: hypothetical protein WC556_01130 [Candidatus Methanoperedens sp.]
MGLFEIYATTSIALAVAIPTFFEKVMRPGYEKRVEKFRKKSLEEFRLSLNEVVEIFNKESELTEEIGEKMDSVVDSWSTVQSNDKKFEELINNRNYVTLGWLLAFSAALLSINSQEFNNILNIEWPKYVTLIFFLALASTIFYLKSLSDFDKELSRFGMEDEKLKEISRPNILSGEVSELRKTELDIESRIIEALKNNAIPFEKDAMGKRNRYDIVIPDIKNPKIFIEIKARLPVLPRISITLDRVISMAVFTKRDYPQSKFILLINNKKKFFLPSVEEFLKYDVDKILDINEINEFITYLKKELDLNNLNK